MLLLLGFLLGACVGSFLNVIIFRAPEHETVVYGRSKCMHCHTTIRAFDLIPVLSFLFLGGRCRNCKHKIDWQYLLLETAIGFLFVLFLTRFLQGATSSPVLFRDCVIGSILVLLFVYDLRYMLIPDKFTIPAIVFVFVMNTGFQIISLSSMLLGMVVVGGFFLVQFLLSQGAWVGGGDIRMGVLMGCLLGVTNGLVALFLSYFIGAIVGGGLLLLKRVNRKTRMPFGTFLVTGTVIVLLTGSSLFHWYFALLQV